ncbi:MAG: SDR family oxidoreductase, partial [Bdellovibrionaceae bacterium]|nr:SDR family oxidoreductase [Pseudobdellovibrionaceae bacterium]
LNNDSDYLKLQDVLASHSEIDFLINNAGVIGGKSSSILTTSAENVLEVFKNNTLNPFKICQTVLPFLRSGGVVSQITSLMGSIEDNQSGGYYDYRISKAALNMLHRCLSIEFKNFIFLTLHPGWVQTDMGGEQAPTTIEESTKGLFKVITEKALCHSGKFLNYQGNELPW